ncbi:MAG: hypothetical protein ACRC4W_02315 [Treponemataceae bacterium]
MKDCSSYIIGCLKEKEKEKFCGSLKFCFEKGKLTQFSVSNRFDVLSTKTNNKFDENEYIKRASKYNFNGCIIFIIEDGLISEYAYSQTFKGEDLKILLK